VRFFRNCDLNPTATGKYILNAATAPKWIGAIAKILGVLRQIFKDESKDSKSKFLNTDRVQGVTAFMYTLYAILFNREVQDLFGLNSLKEITPDYLANAHILPSLQPEEGSSDEYLSETVDQSPDVTEVDNGEFSFFNFPGICKRY